MNTEDAKKIAEAIALVVKRPQGFSIESIKDQCGVCFRDADKRQGFPV